MKNLQSLKRLDLEDAKCVYELVKWVSYVVIMTKGDFRLQQIRRVFHKDDYNTCLTDSSVMTTRKVWSVEHSFKKKEEQKSYNL